MVRGCDLGEGLSQWNRGHWDQGLFEPLFPFDIRPIAQWLRLEGISHHRVFSFYLPPGVRLGTYEEVGIPYAHPNPSTCRSSLGADCNIEGLVVETGRGLSVVNE